MSVLWEMPLDDEAKHWVGVARELNRDHFVPLAAELDREQRYPWENVQLLVDSGLCGLMVPAEFGGAGATLATWPEDLHRQRRRLPALRGVRAHRSRRTTE